MPGWHKKYFDFKYPLWEYIGALLFLMPKSWRQITQLIKNWALVLLLQLTNSQSSLAP